MEDDILQQIVYSIQSGLGQVKEESHEFRLEAERQNFSMSKFMSDLSSKFFVTQNKQQADLNDSMDEVERQSAATNQNINELQSITQESVSLLSQISMQMKDVAQGIGSLVQLFQQNSGQNQFSFGGIGQGLGALVGGAAATAAIGGGLATLTQAGSAQAGQILPGGGNSDTGGSGETLSVAEMTRLAKQAGFNDEEAAIMGAIGAAESSGNPRAHNPDASTGDNSYGLWQINMLGNMGPERRRQFGIENNEQLWDPSVNAKAAKTIFDQQGFKAWSVYKSGAYKQYLGTAQESLQSGSGENTNVEASKDEQDGKVVNGSNITNSMGSLNSRGELGERKGFIIHHTGGRGDVGGVINTLNQRGLSVQYVIDREGKIHQLMPSGSRASHMRKGQGVGAGLSNSNTEGVEIIAKDDSDVLPVQVEAAKRLAQQLGYAPNQVYGHGEVNPHKQKTEGATVVSAIRGGAPPASPSESQSASGSTGLSGESGTAMGGGQGGGGESNPFAGTPFAGLTSQISGALATLTGFGQSGAGMLGGGMPMMGAAGMLGAAMPMIGSMIEGLSSVFSNSNNKPTEYKSDAQAVAQNDKPSQVSEMSNNLSVERTVAEITKQENKTQPATETSIQSRPTEGVRGPAFTPTPSFSISWVDWLGGRNKFPRSFNINGVYS